MEADEERRLIAEILAESERWKRFDKLAFSAPYPKQREFHTLGAACRERGLIAANRVGKSECAAAETAMHLTGRYPEGWTGHKFDYPITAWAAGEDGELVRDVSQAKLCGTPGVVEDFGTGYIPKDAFVDRPSLARGTTDLYDTVHVRHASGGVSALTFKTYGEGRKGFQAATLHWFWADEEPDEDIYFEGLTRLATTQGHSVLTCTPLKGRTTLIRRLLDEEAAGRGVVRMGIYDAGHFTKEQADAEIVRYQPHERDARAYGIPQMGEGRVFMTEEAALRTPRIPVPPHWPKLWGMDFGGQGERSHPWAAALIAIDRDNDIIFLVSCLRMRSMTKLQHIPAVRRIAANVPVAWPHDGNEKREGQTIAQQYREPLPGMPGLLMLPTQSKLTESVISKCESVHELDDRCQTGRFLVFDTPENAAFFDEYRQYHQEANKLVGIDDDVISAVFKTLMMKRAARAVPLGDDISGATRKRQQLAIPDIDIFSGEPIDNRFRI